MAKPLFNSGTHALEHPATDDAHIGLLQLLNQGLYLQAWHLAHSTPTVHAPTPEFHFLLSQIYHHLGQPRLGHAIALALWRRQPQNHDYAYATSRYWFRKFGPLATWTFLEQHQPSSSDQAHQSDWLALRAMICSQLKDWETARLLLEEAQSNCVTEANLTQISRSNAFLLTHQGLFDAAEACLGERWAQHKSAPLLVHWAQSQQRALGSDRAIELLEHHAPQFESIRPWLLLTALSCETCNWAMSELGLDKINSLLRGSDKQTQRQINAFEHQVQVAKEAAKTTPSPCIKTLPVPKVLQKNRTCVPASLWALAQYWKLDTTLEQLNPLSFGGTTPQTVRDWLTDKGLPYAEFELSWDAAKQLIDLDIPFALTSVSGSGTHMQVVHGYNTLKKTLLIMDSELDIRSQWSLAHDPYAHVLMGPRCLVFAPPKTRDTRIFDHLPQAKVYAAYARFESALALNDMQAQTQALEHLEQAFAGARLTELAHYEMVLSSGNEAHILARTQALLDLYPEDIRLITLVIQCLKRLGRYPPAQRLLDKALNKNPDIALLQLYVEDFKDAPILTPQQRSGLRQLIHHGYHSPRTALVLAQRCHKHHQLNQALTFYRWALTLDDTNEHTATEYFRAATQLNKADSALNLLKQRWRTYQARSAGPVMSLYSAYRFLNESDQGLNCLAQNLTLRPDDSELIAFYCAKLIETGHQDQFTALFSANRHKLEPQTAEALEAMALKHHGELIEASDRFAALHAKHPLNTFYAETLFGLQRALGLSADIDKRLQELCEQFDQSFLVLNLARQWHSQASERHRILQQMAQCFPDLLPIRLKAAHALLDMNDLDTAEGKIATLCQDFPSQASIGSLKARHHWLRGDIEKAREEAMRALNLDCSDVQAAQLLLASTPGIEAKEAAINHLYALIEKQEAQAAIGPWWHLARQWITPIDLLAQCHSFANRQPAQAQAWLALAHQLQDMHQPSEALTVLNKGIATLPNAPELQLAQAEVQARLGEIALASQTLETLYQSNPEWLEPAKRLAQCLQQLGQHERATQVLSNAIRHNPDDGTVQGLLADAQWQLGNHNQALSTLSNAVRLNMDYPWAWDRLRHWGAHQGQPDLAAELARNLVKERPNSPVAWRILAQLENTLSAALVDFDQALRLAPFDTKTHLARAELLQLSGNPEAAIDHLSQISWPGEVPEPILLQHVDLLLNLENTQGAGALLHSALKLYPRSIALLARWLELLKNQHPSPTDQLLECTHKLAALSPGEASVLCECAENLLQQSDQSLWPQAAQWLERAFALDPTDSYIGLTWWDYLLSHGPLQSAKDVERLTERSSEQQWWLPRHIKRCCLSDEFDQALTAWQSLITLPTDSIWPKEAAFAVLTHSRVCDEALLSLESAFIQEQGCAELFDIWQTFMLNKTGHIQSVESLLHRMPPGPLWRGCAERYLCHLGELHRLPSEQFFASFRPILQSHYALLAAMGRLLCADGHYDACLHWYHSADLDQQCPAFVHHHFHEVLLELGCYERAYEQMVLAQQAPRDHCHDGVAIWQITHAFLAHGTASEALNKLAMLEHIQYEHLNATEQYVFGLLYIVNHLEDEEPHQMLEKSLLILKKISPLWAQANAKTYLGALRDRLANLLIAMAHSEKKVTRRLWNIARIKRFLI